MQAHVAAATLCFVILGYINVAVCEGPWCYVCDKAVKPGSCGEIVKCSDDEQCYASSTGVSPTQYTAGCKKKQLCQGTGSVAGGSSPHSCEECCFGDHCNSDLCGGLPVPKGGNRLCLQCEAVEHPSQCTTASKCGQDKYCSIWKKTRFDLTFFDLGCLEKSQCVGHMKGVDQLVHEGFICCNDDFCNSHENNDHLTPAPTSPTTTTSLPTTTIRTGNIKCKMCPYAEQPSSCESETECGPDQYCSVKKVFQFGQTFYDLGCEEKTECVGHMTILGEDGIRCCNEDLCNADANPVTGSTTPAATAPATAETSTSTAKTSSLPPTTTIRTGNLKCKKCGFVPQPSSCQEETYCGPDQYCSVRRIFQLVMTVYDLGCEEKTECVGHMTTLGEDGFRCCNEDLCNADVNPVTGTTTPAATAPATPESSTSPTNSSPLPTMAPHILNTNQTVNAILGTTVLLLCNVTGNPEPSVTWTYDKQVNPNAHPRGSTLAISSVNEKNGGIYRCVANNTLGTKEGIVHLHVTEPVSVKAVPPIMVITPLKPLRLKCVGEGIPTPKVTLSKYGEDISADKSYHNLGPAEFLIIGITEANMLKYDGVYVCNATNGQTSATANQIVAVNVTEMLGENHPFDNISSTPLKAFHAFCTPGSMVPDASPITTEFDLSEPICTSARKVGLIHSDAGTVTWLVRPDGKAQFLNGSVNVDFEHFSSTAVSPASTTGSSLASSAATSTPPLTAPDILNPNQTVNAALGKTVLLFCNVSGNPTPSVTWIYDQSVNPNAHPKESTLAISSVLKNNEGVYRCEANNSLGTKEGVVHLHVTEPVSVKGEPAIVVITPGMRFARLKCVGEGIPPPSVTLSKYGEDISADKSYHHISSAEILIMGITEANMLKYDGVYVCNATNGETSATAYQIVAINVTTPVDGQVPFSNISTTPLKAFQAQCPSGHTGPDGSPITREFNLDEFICASAREVGVIDTNPGPVTWVIRPEGKAQFLNGSANVDFGIVNSTAVITTPSTSLSSSATIAPTQSSLLSLPPLPSTMSNIHNVVSLTTPLMVMTPSFVTHVPLNSIQTNTQSGNIISSHSSFDVIPTSQSQFLPPVASSKVALTMMATSSLSQSMAMTSLPSSVTSSSQASAGTYASSRGVSSSGMTSSSPSPSMAMTSLPSSVTSSSQASAGTYASSRGVSSSGMTSSSPSPSLAMTFLPSSVTSSSQASAGTYASSRGVSSSGMTSSSPSPSLAMTSLPSSVTSSSQASAGTYASSRGVSSSGMTSSSPSPSMAMTSLPSSVTSSSQASAGTYASSRGVSSSGMTSVVAMTSLPFSVTSSSQANAGTYASSRGVSSSGMTSSSPSPSLAMTSLPSSVKSSSQASAGTYASSRGVSSSMMTSSSPAPAIEPTSTISSSQLRTGVSSSSVALPSVSPTFQMSVSAPSVSSGAYLLSSQSSLNKHISSHPTASLSGPTSFTPFLSSPTSSLMSLPVAAASITQTSITGLLSQIISPSSSAMTTGQSTARPGTYRQEATTEATTVTTTEPRVAPHIPNPSQSVNAFTGKDVILSCNVTGVPEPRVTWYYDKQNIFNAKPDGNNLRLAYVTKDNSGDYTCVAENNVGQANGTVHVQTHEPLTISAKKPIVILEPDGFGNEMECVVEGDPAPKVTWSKYGGVDLSSDQTVVDFGDGELLLTGVTKANLEQYEGIYICQADNGISSNKAYVVAAANISESMDSSKKFNEFSMKSGAALHATCVPGTVDADGSPLSTTFGPSDSICDSARRVGVLAKDSGPVTWFIRLDGKAEFVNETKGAGLSMADALTTRDTPMSDPPSAATTVIAPLTCETCSGGTCGIFPGKDTPCSIMTPFCMNTVIVKKDESRIVTKSCASSGDCETKWWQQTSDQDRCTNMQPGNPYMEDFTCSYCCTTPGCNKDVFPKKDTLYKGNA
ncbi:hemicentin-1-like [Haliotis rubra]|uniref:hemicentin-1-like n=1 Tax=Haliotis rubra TaxID=36100 RepID=UPI001EE5F1AC|nr:hemicentin-1-like [Haliotis rubra]